MTWTEIVPIGKDEKAFFVQLGARIARLRKQQHITQVQLAELLNVSQQTINAYEVGRRRMPVSSLPPIARFLGVSIEELLCEPISPPPKNAGRPRRFSSRSSASSACPRPSSASSCR